MTIKPALLCVVLVASFAGRAAAQQLPTAAERHAADVASWATVGTAVALDVADTVAHHCRGTWDDCHDHLVMMGARYGATFGVVWLTKTLIHEHRPCAPDCGIDSADTSFLSGHTAFAFTAIGGPRLAFTLPLAVGTGGLRVAAGKHYAWDVLAGAGIGLLTGRLH